MGPDRTFAVMSLRLGRSTHKQRQTVS